MADDEDSDEAPAEEAPETEAPTRPPAAAPSLSRFVLIFLFILSFWTLFDPQLAGGFAAVAGAVLMPVLGFGGALPVITILVAGALTTTASSIVRDYFTNWVKMARTNRVMAAWRKEQMDAMRKGNEARLKKLQEIQKGFSKDAQDMIFAPYKSMAVTTLAFVIMFTWIRSFVDSTLLANGNPFIAVPWSSNVWLPSIYVFPSWVLLYSLLAIPFGQIVSRALKYFRFRRRLRELDVPLNAEADGAS